MRRPLMYLLAWALAAVVIVTVSWLGIRTALGAAVPMRATPLSPADLRQAVPETSAPTSAASPSASASPTPTETQEAESSPAATETTTTATATAPASETWTSKPDDRGGTGYERDFDTSGGSVTVWSSRGEVRVLACEPRSGWDYLVRQDSQDSVTVTFFVPEDRTRTAYVAVGWLNDGPIVEFGESFGLTG